jgi:hypothetical protein
VSHACLVSMVLPGVLKSLLSLILKLRAALTLVLECYVLLEKLEVNGFV